MSWIVGLAVALVFGLIAYLYYEVAVFIGMTSIGFVLGTGAMAFLGITWSWLVILVGVITAAVLAVVAIVGDMPMVLLTVLTALAGATRDHHRADAPVRARSTPTTSTRPPPPRASTTTGGGTRSTSAWRSSAAISQFRANELREDTLRAAWRGVDEPASLH